MSNPKWTDMQSAAINDTGNNLLVSAAAGSGKTAVMIERIFRLIKEKKTSADRILVVTFTNAAASSMRIKLAERLDREISENPDDAYFRRQRQLLDRADISTIHSFCCDLIRKYYFHTPLSPDFRILDDTSANMFSAEAMSEILEEAAIKYENGFFDEYFDAINQFASEKNDNGLCDAILSLNKYLSVMVDPDSFENKTLEFYSSANNSQWVEILLEHIRKISVFAVNYAEEAAAKYVFNPYSDKITSDANKLAEIFENIACAKSIEEVTVAIPQKMPSFQGKKYGDAVLEYCSVRQKLLDFRKEINKSIKDIKPTNTSALNAVKALFYLQKNYLLRFEDKCYEAGGITFDGLLRLSANLINTNSDIRSELQRDTDYIFVDEYQDVNELQNSIVESISRGDNLFYVGDVKQSIYSFQLASPDIFLGKMRQYASGILGKRINLANNFRSSSPILDGINFIFSSCMFEDSSEIEYDIDEALYPSPDENSIQYKKTLFSGETPEAETEFLFTDTNVMSEEEAIARRICALKNSTIFDDKLNDFRPLRYGDIVILGVKNDAASALDAMFSVYGIPFSSKDKKDKKSFDAIGAIISLLRLLEIRRRDTDLITVLLSAIGKFTCNELALIRASHPEGTFFDAFYSFDGDTVLKERIRAFFAELDRLELLQATMTLPDFISYVYSKTGFIYHVAYSEDRYISEENVKTLISAARTYSENYSGGLRGFLSYYEALALDNGKNDVQISENDDSVHYMTIHKSKGLEFPVVFLVRNCESAINSREFKKVCFSKNSLVAFKVNSTDEYGIRKTYEPISLHALKEEKTESLLAEKMRLLYVALTRAKNKIIVSIADEKKNLAKCIALPSKFISATYKNYADLLIPILYFSLDGEPLRAWLNDINDGIDNDINSDIGIDSNCNCTATPHSFWSVKFAEDFADTANISDGDTEDFDKDAYLSSVKDAIAWRYPYISAVEARAKQNPSKSNIHTRMALRKPEFENAEYHGAQKGTVVHFFMQHFDFNSTESPYEQASDMLSGGMLSNEEFNALPFNHINAFVQSEFAQRIKNADKVYRERSFCKIIPFEESGDEALMQGTIDCYFFEGDNIILLDYKTDIIKNGLEERIEHHRKQLEMYASALEKLYPKKSVTSYIHFFSVDKTIKL